MEPAATFWRSAVSDLRRTIDRRLRPFDRRICPDSTDPHTIGAFGEEAAAAFLRRRGFRILTRNYRTRLGEIDLVCRDGQSLVFVEVKTRHHDAPICGMAAVDRRKQKRLIRAAHAYLRELTKVTPPCRYDIVEVTLRPGEFPAFHYAAAAFDTSFLEPHGGP